MNAETLYDCITDLPEGMVEEAEAHVFRQKRERRLWTAVAAVTLVAALGLLLHSGALHGMGSAGGGDAGGADGFSYMQYVGPVLPLTALNGAEDVAASRTEPVVMPRIWQAARWERNVREDGCEKYSIARLCASTFFR